MRIGVLAAVLALSATASMAHAADWVIATDLYGNVQRQTLRVQEEGGRLSGDLDGDAVSGERRGRRVAFTVTGSKGWQAKFEGEVAGERMTGTVDRPDLNDAKARSRHAFTARLVPEREAGPARLVDFAPTSFSNTFNADTPPATTIWPGDTIRTSTIDSGGVDAQGVTRALYGNPQTGPFFVAGARAGDVLAVHIKRLRPNRDWADSLDAIVGRAQTTALAVRGKDLGKPVRWTLDRQRGLARPSAPSPALQGYEIPLRPMLGGIAVAPDFGFPPFSTGDTGRFGGNMDFNEITEGATVYLPVFQPGALLYIGDAHAAQGDGETSQFALETSMDVEFSVEVLPRRPLSAPRVESGTELMVLGQSGSLDEAVRLATAGLVQWLEQDYGLSLSEAAQVLGTSVRYSVVTLAGRNGAVAARLDKARLKGLARKPFVSPAPPPAG